MKTFKLLWRLILYRPWLYLLNIILWAVIEVVPLVPGLIFKEILDSLSKNTDLGAGFWWLVGLIILVYLVRISLTYAGTAVFVFFDFNICSLLRQNILKEILKRPGAQPMSVAPGEALNRLRDDVQAVVDMFDWPLDVFGKLLCAATAVGILFSVNARMTLLVFIPMLIVLSLVQQVRRYLRKYREASRQATSRVIDVLNEMFNSVQAIKVAGAEDHIIKHFQKLSEKRHKAGLKETLFIKLLDAALNNVVHLGTGLILLLGAQSMRTGEFTVGDFALFTTYWFYVADFTNIFGGLLSAYQQGLVSLKRLVEMLEGDPAGNLVKHESLYLKKNPVMVDGVNVYEEDKLKRLDVRNLTYKFKGSDGGIQDVSFTVRGGTFTVITGRIGSGKSTLLRVLLGLLPSDAGEIFWNGKLIKDPATFFVPPRCAYTPQIPHLFSDTVRNNILLGVKDEKNLKKAIHLAVLEQDLAEFDQGLDTLIGPRGIKLSGGQIQRVAAARMFANDAQLYVFDDISSALDVETEIILLKQLFSQSEISCLAVSNRRIALQKADQIIVMKDGKVEGHGTLEELLRTCEEMQKIYNLGVETA